MNRLITAIIALLIFSMAVSGQAYQSVNYGGRGAANDSIITIAANSSYSNTTDQQVIYLAEAYIANRLGQQYYNSYVSYYGSQSYGNISYVYFTYNVPFENGILTTNTYGIQGPQERPLGITISLNGTTVTGYTGPPKPYIIMVTQPDAVNISYDYGIQSGNASIEGLFNSSGIRLNSTYFVVWAVVSGNPLKSGVYQGIYIDAQSGNVLGEYEYAPTLIPSQYGPPYGVSGNFSMFYMQNQTSGAQSSNPDGQYIIPLIVLAFVILAIGLYFSRERR